jgi:hypothetical protein
MNPVVSPELERIAERLRESTAMLKVVYTLGVHTKRLESIGEAIDANNEALSALALQVEKEKKDLANAQNVVTDGPSQPAVPNIERFKDGPKTLDAKWLDHECWDGCQSLRFKGAMKRAIATLTGPTSPSARAARQDLIDGLSVPPLQPTSSTQPTEGRASAEGEQPWWIEERSGSVFIYFGHRDNNMEMARKYASCLQVCCNAHNAACLPNIDTQRLDWLEDAIWNHPDSGNGIALFPFTNVSDKRKGVNLQGLGDEDGSNLGEDISGSSENLRAAIDKAMALPSPEPVDSDS